MPNPTFDRLFDKAKAKGLWVELSANPAVYVAGRMMRDGSLARLKVMRDEQVLCETSVNGDLEKASKQLVAKI